MLHKKFDDRQGRNSNEDTKRDGVPHFDQEIEISNVLIGRLHARTVFRASTTEIKGLYAIKLIFICMGEYI